MSVTRCLTLLVRDSAGDSIVLNCNQHCEMNMLIFSLNSDMRKDVQEIFKLTPHDKQVMMFSATLSKEIGPICKKFMQDVRHHFHIWNFV